ncbi:hypothetical protein [Streptomyces sp. RPT161]|uniref:hypothetical protein n=1 Tax=Streptomyces sp. RPT161 TaxID=3015993 RepID=UPI0022B92ECF|nr:hypothetical protein [Streptomyces sp. RPT161]
MTSQPVDNQGFRSPLFVASIMFVLVVLMALSPLVLNGGARWTALTVLVVVEFGLAVLMGLRIAQSRSDR